MPELGWAIPFPPWRDIRVPEKAFLILVRFIWTVKRLWIVDSWHVKDVGPTWLGGSKALLGGGTSRKKEKE